MNGPDAAAPGPGGTPSSGAAGGPLSAQPALVTGAGSGIGRATAVALAAAGAPTMVADLDAGAARETVARIRAAGGTAEWSRVDVSRGEEVRELIADTVAALGGLAIAVNNAGIGARRALLAEADEADFDEQIRVNLKGVWLCLKYELAHMVPAGGGAIVNTASALALRVAAGMSGYALSKAGVAYLTQMAAAEYAPRGIRINAVCPGPVRTPMLERLPGHTLRRLAAEVPLGRLAGAEEVAASIAWLCSPAAAYLTGVLLPVDGGESVKSTTT
jgi:NAD(P)-dependent dehydrogenase (short-subunit alcohol dehydrogenase family)